MTNRFVVSGVPGSGTTVAMQMLEAGGIPVNITPLYGQDEKHPLGRYEWVERAEHIGTHGFPVGAVKIVWGELQKYHAVPQNYRLVLMRRQDREGPWLSGLPNLPTLMLDYYNLLDGVGDLASFCGIPENKIPKMLECWKRPVG